MFHNHTVVDQAGSGQADQVEFQPRPPTLSAGMLTNAFKCEASVIVYHFPGKGIKKQKFPDEQQLDKEFFTLRGQKLKTFVFSVFQVNVLTFKYLSKSLKYIFLNLHSPAGILLIQVLTL